MTLIGPSSVLHGTTAVALVSLMNVHVTAASGPDPASKSTPVMPVKPVPVIETSVPGAPFNGVNDVTAAFAEAGSAVRTSATSASASADAVVRAFRCFLRSNFMDITPSLVPPRWLGLRPWRTTFERSPLHVAPFAS